MSCRVRESRHSPLAALKQREPKAAREVVSSALSLTRIIWNRGAYHATKATLAGLRPDSIRSAGCRYGYDCTARTYHLNRRQIEFRLIQIKFSVRLWPFLIFIGAQPLFISRIDALQPQRF
jgi:hypothetical protein